MATAEVALDTTQYVRVNIGKNPIMLQALRDTVRVTFSESQPVLGNTAFHMLSGSSEPFQVPILDANVWVLAMTDRSSLIVTETEDRDQDSYGYDAWGRKKAIVDYRLFSGLFTYNVPGVIWKETFDEVEQAVTTYATSVNGKLNLISSGTLNQRIAITSLRNPRYEPNRGHLYSASIFLPNSTDAGQRSFGVFTRDSGVLFRLKSDGNLYAVRRNTVDAVVVEDEQQITIPASVDLSKGNTYDIQFQWRGVGDYKFFINQEVVHTIELIGTLDELSMFNPSAPANFECINQGDDVVINCGCVDITSEGGSREGGSYASIPINSTTGSVAVSGFDTPVLVVRNKSEFGTLINTRDVEALIATGYSDQRSVLRIWLARDPSVITLNDQVWSDYGDAHVEYIRYNLNADGTPLVGTPMTFDTTQSFLGLGVRVDQDSNYAATATFNGRSQIHQPPGQIFIFTIHRENGGNANVGVTYEFAELI